MTKYNLPNYSKYSAEEIIKVWEYRITHPKMTEAELTKRLGMEEKATFNILRQADDDNLAYLGYKLTKGKPYKWERLNEPAKVEPDIFTVINDGKTLDDLLKDLKVIVRDIYKLGIEKGRKERKERCQQ